MLIVAGQLMGGRGGGDCMGVKCYVAAVGLSVERYVICVLGGVASCVCQ